MTEKQREEHEENERQRIDYLRDCWRENEN